MSLHVLAINPGSTSTKIAWFTDGREIWRETVRHDPEALGVFPSVAEQFQFRLDTIAEAVASKGCSFDDLSAVAGRGGLVEPIPGGTYAVDDVLLKRLRMGKPWEHASNLGGILADAICRPRNIPAFIVDPVAVDEMNPAAKVTGLPELPKLSLGHALNVKATVRRAAKDLGEPWDSKNFIVAHIGGGITVCAHEKGRMTDLNNANDFGPFSPERAGGLPAGDLLRFCFESGLTEKEVLRKVVGKGGLAAYTGTSDVREVKALIAEGDEYALRGTVAGPISETVLGRLTAFTKSQKGHIKNVSYGRDLNGFDNWGLRGKILVQPSDALDLTFIADYRDTQQDCCAYQIRDTSTALNPVVGATLDSLLDPVVASPENRQTKLNAPVYNNSEQWGLSGKAEYRFGNGYTFTSITAYREWDFENNLDVDALDFEDPIPGVVTFDLNSGQTSLSQTSQEFRLASPEWDHFDYVVGVYLFELDLDRSFRRRIEARTAAGIVGQSGQFNGSVGNKNYAAFASGNYHFGQGTTIFGGLRLINETLEYQVYRDPANVLQ
ncbi:MAG TPA: butyrate kinase, partial [Synergistales bacterium]|nr:butyrate kinase [Synergistales bacterium]